MSPRSASTRPHVAAPDTKHEMTERLLLTGAAELIVAGASWHSLGIGKIAAQAGISRTAFYDFFASKNELLGQLLGGLYEELSELLRETVVTESAGTPDLERLRPGLAVLVEFSSTNGHVYRAFLEATGEDEALDAQWHELSATSAALITEAIEAARRHDAAVPTDPPARPLAQILLAMTERTLLLLLRTADPAEHEPLVEALALTWERAVFGRSAR